MIDMIGVGEMVEEVIGGVDLGVLMYAHPPPLYQSGPLISSLPTISSTFIPLPTIVWNSADEGSRGDTEIEIPVPNAGTDHASDGMTRTGQTEETAPESGEDLASEI